MKKIISLFLHFVLLLAISPEVFAMDTNLEDNYIFNINFADYYDEMAATYDATKSANVYTLSQMQAAGMPVTGKNDKLKFTITSDGVANIKSDDKYTKMGFEGLDIASGKVEFNIKYKVTGNASGGGYGYNTYRKIFVLNNNVLNDDTWKHKEDSIILGMNTDMSKGLTPGIGANNASEASTALAKFVYPGQSYNYVFDKYYKAGTNIYPVKILVSSISETDDWKVKVYDVDPDTGLETLLLEQTTSRENAPTLANLGMAWAVNAIGVLSWNAKYIPITPPEIVETTADLGLRTISPVLSITFNNSLDENTIDSVRFVDSEGTDLTKTRKLSDDGTVLTLTTENLVHGQMYSIIVESELLDSDGVAAVYHTRDITATRELNEKPKVQSIDVEDSIRTEIPRLSLTFNNQLKYETLSGIVVLDEEENDVVSERILSDDGFSVSLLLNELTDGAEYTIMVNDTLTDINDIKAESYQKTVTADKSLNSNPELVSSSLGEKIKTLSPSFMLTFNKALNPDTLSAITFKNSQGVDLVTGRTLSEDGLKVTVTTADLEDGSEYIAEVTNALLDTEGFKAEAVTIAVVADKELDKLVNIDFSTLYGENKPGYDEATDTNILTGELLSDIGIKGNNLKITIDSDGVAKVAAPSGNGYYKMGFAGMEDIRSGLLEFYVTYKVTTTNAGGEWGYNAIRKIFTLNYNSAEAATDKSTANVLVMDREWGGLGPGIGNKSDPIKNFNSNSKYAYTYDKHKDTKLYTVRVVMSKPFENYDWEIKVYDVMPDTGDEILFYETAATSTDAPSLENLGMRGGGGSSISLLSWKGELKSLKYPRITDEVLPDSDILIKFPVSISDTVLTGDSIKLMDNSGNAINADIKVNEDFVVLTPKKYLNYGEEYRIDITGVTDIEKYTYENAFLMFEIAYPKLKTRLVTIDYYDSDGKRAELINASRLSANIKLSNDDRSERTVIASAAVYDENGKLITASVSDKLISSASEISIPIAVEDFEGAVKAKVTAYEIKDNFIKKVY